MDESPEETPRRRRLRKLAEPPKRKPTPLRPLLVASGVSLVILLVVLVATIWERFTLPPEERAAELQHRQPEPDVQDPELDKARELYGQALELMARRRFDDAGAVIEEARGLHIKLLGRYDKHPRLSKLIEGQERQLCHQERLLSERAAAEDLRPMALESQRRTRQANLKKALALAEGLRQEGKYDDAIDLLNRFAQEHRDFDVANKAQEEARRLEQEIEATYGAAVKEAEEHYNARRYGQAMRVLMEFVRDYSSERWETEAKRIMEGLQKGTGDRPPERPRRNHGQLVLEYRFDEALAQYKTLRAKFDGTGWDGFVPMRIVSIQAQADLHFEVCHRLRMKSGRGKPATFKMKREGKEAEVSITGADEQKLELLLPGGGKEQAMWKDLPARKAYEIYRLCIPEPTKDKHAQLAEFCQERDLVDEADLHFEAAEE